MVGRATGQSKTLDAVNTHVASESTTKALFQQGIGMFSVDVLGHHKS